KRELALGHAALASLPSESSYAAIITLVEGVIAATRWGDLSDHDFELLKEGLASGLIADIVSPDEYLRQARTLHGSCVRAGPTFELNGEDGTPEGDQDTDESTDEPG